MSGPKVVRVRTREERLADAQAWISRVEAASRRWERQVRATGLATATEIDATITRGAELSRLLGSHQFEVVERQARQEIGFLDRDLERRRQAEAERRAQRRTRNRRMVSAAGSVLASCRNAGKTLPTDVTQSLERAASGRSDNAEAIEAAIARALETLAEPSGAGRASKAQAELAGRLGSDSSPRTLAEWLAEQPAGDEPIAGGLDADLARFELEAGLERAAPFAERARCIAAEVSDGRRRLLYDSLRVDLSAAFADWRSREDLREALAVLVSELATIQDHSQAAEFKRSIEDLLKNPTPKVDAMTALRERAGAWLAGHRVAASTQARRDAVLSGLAAVGYEVREGVSGIWPQGARLILRRGDSPDVGVELSGNLATGRLQIRPVGLEDATNPWDHGRDIDIEQRFCEEVRQLGGRLKQNGVEVAIERASPVGAQPLKTSVRVERPSDEQRRGTNDRHMRGQR